MGKEIVKFVNGDMYSYELFDIVDPYSQVLRERTPEFDFANPPVKPMRLGVSLIETMVKAGGIGIAAPQVGLPYRVFAVGDGKQGYACFNPQVLSQEGQIKMEEGCLSFPGLFLPVTRPLKIRVRFTDWNGTVKEEEFSGLTARTFLHELDHLNGIVFTSKVSPVVLERARSKVKVNKKKIAKWIAARDANSTEE